jgi:hypothetical protein
MFRNACVACVGLLVLGFSTSVTTADDITIGIQVSPSTINLDQKGEWVTVHADIPLGLVEAGLTLNGVEVWYTKDDARGDLVAKFLIGDVLEIVATPNATLTLRGTTTNGDAFSGTDTVPVIDPPDKKK